MKNLSFFILLIFSFLSAEVLKPIAGGDEKEILTIAGKRRIYTFIESDTVTYQVRGPVRIQLIARYPSPNKTKKSQTFAYSIKIDNENPLNIQHRYKIQRSIRSVQHPNHYYTYSGEYYFNLGEGEHILKFVSEKDQKYPVLLRVIKRDFETSIIGKKEIQPMVFQSNRKVTTGGKTIAYYELAHDRPLQVEINGPKRLRILSRLVFDSTMGDEESYRIRLMSENKVLGTYFMSTEQSTESAIEGLDDKTPGEWRTCEIDIPNGKQVITVELVEKDRSVLTRFQEYK